MKKKIVGIIVCMLLIVCMTINLNVPIKAEVTQVDHKIVLDPNLPSWNKKSNDYWGTGWSESDKNHGYAEVFTGHLVDYECGGANFKHWFKWTAPCDVSDARVAFTYCLDSIDVEAHTSWPTGWAHVRADYLFFVNEHEESVNLFNWEGWDGQSYSNHDPPPCTGPDMFGLTFEKGQTYNIGVQFEIRAEISGQADATIIADVDWIENDYTDLSEILILWENRKPLTPDPPIGPISGSVNVEYEYKASTTDPDTDEIYYQFDWDDGPLSEWYGPYTSGSECEASHTWTEVGTYYITVRARDSYSGSETAWSNPLHLLIPKDVTSGSTEVT